MDYLTREDSYWNCYWSDTLSVKTRFRLPTKKSKDGQVFEIYDIISYSISYGEIIFKGIDMILSEIYNFYNSTHTIDLIERVGKCNRLDEDTCGEENHICILTKVKKEVPMRKVTEENLKELKSALEMFILDVDNHYKWKTFIKREWINPIFNINFQRNKMNFHIY